MKTIQAKSYDRHNIIVSNLIQLNELYMLITKDEDFIITWKMDKVIYSEIIIGSNFNSKVKNGEIVLVSLEEN